MRGVIKGGEIIPCDVSVIDGREAKLWWKPPNRSRFRTAPVRLAVWHHTGGEAGHEGIHETLRRRHLSVHFTVADGTIAQHADLDTWCYHAGRRGNSQGVGIEVKNRGLAPALPGHLRTVYTGRMHDHDVRFLRFFPEDVASCMDLFLALSRVLDIPATFPTDGGMLTRQVMTDAELVEYRGHVGHCHLSPRKLDPSPHLMEDLQSRACLP